MHHYGSLFSECVFLTETMVVAIEKRLIKESLQCSYYDKFAKSFNIEKGIIGEFTANTGHLCLGTIFDTIDTSVRMKINLSLSLSLSLSLF